MLHCSKKSGLLCVSNLFKLIYSNFQRLKYSAHTQIEENEKKKTQLILMEYELFKVSGEPCPSSLNEVDIKKMLQLPNKYQRRKYFYYLFKKEEYSFRKLEMKKHKKAQILERREEKISKDQHNHLKYGIGLNAIFFRLSPQIMHIVDYHKLAQSVMFGQKIVFDFSYDDYMNEIEKSLLTSQLKMCYLLNKNCPEPYHIHYCSADQGQLVLKNLQSQLPALNDYRFFGDITNNSYLKLFPKNKLVYLSSHSRNVLRTYDHEAIYIIGSFVEKGKTNKISLSKSKVDGIKVFSLPIDNYIAWQTGVSKSLPLHHVMKILSEMKITNCWKKSFNEYLRWTNQSSDSNLKKLN